MARFGEINAQYFDDAGDPLGGGKLYFYESGTTTLKNTYADINLTIPNTNPVILTAAGRQPNIFFNGNAKGILADKNDVQILVRDPVGETGTNFGDPWVATTIYSTNSVVIGSDGVYYRSLSNGNQNNNPTTTSGFWTLLYSVQWNAGITYDIGAVVTYDNQQYQSLQTSNLNQNPETQTAYWVGLEFAWIATATYAEDQNVVGTDGILYTSLQAANIGNDPATSPTYWVGTSAAAAASAVAAAASAAAALVSENAAATSETNAAASETAAAASETAAAASESAAATSETNAATSASNAATSETNAAASETAAASSASAASTSETNAAASASAASTSEINAAASETAAAASETAAAASESAAATSETNAASSASAASTSASNASTSETNAATSATSATGSATAAASSATDAATAETGAEDALAEFETQYLGSSATAPTGSILTGALYFNTVSNTMFVYTGSSWAAAGSAVNGTAERQEYIATSGQTNFSATYDVGFVDVYLNGSKLIPTTDFTATDGATIILGTGATTGDNVSIIAYGAFNVADTYTQAQADAKFAQVTNNLSDLDDAATSLTNLGLTATATELNYTDGVTSNIQTQIDNIDALPSQTGNAGNYLTTDGTDASWAEISASPTLEATASGTLANGDMVIVNADGTVSVVTQTIDPTPVVGSSEIFESANSDTISSTFDSTSNKVIICYRDAGNSDYGTAVVGEISGNSISFGTPVIFQSVDSRDSSITYDSNANKVLIVYGRNSGYISGNAIVGTVSGNSITFGSTAEFEAASVEDTSCTFDSTANKVVIGCRQATGSYSFIISATISGTSVSFGSPEGWENGSKIRVNYDANSNKTIITYRDSSNRPRAIVATLSGTAFSLGSIVPLSTNSVTYPISTIDTNLNKVVAAWVYSNTIYAAVGTVSGTTISFGSASTYSSGAVNYMNMTFDTSTNKLVIVYRDDSNSSRGTAIIGTVSGTTVSFANKTVFNAATTNYAFVTFDSNSGKNLISYQNNGNSNYGTSTVFSSATITTNLTEGNFIGVSDSAYSDGATAKIQLVGSVDDAQSGLTAGQSYYVQGDGTLATSPDSPSVFAGTAVSATNLIVKG